MDWFLYDSSLRHERVKTDNYVIIHKVIVQVLAIVIFETSSGLDLTITDGIFHFNTSFTTSEFVKLKKKHH